MIDLPQLNNQIKALHKGDESTRREMIHALKQYKEQEWAAAPPQVISTLVESLQGTLFTGVKQPVFKHEVAMIFGNIGPRSKSTIPLLIEWLEKESPNPVREAAAAALGKMGKEAKSAVPSLIAALASGRPALIIQSVRALGNIGCADQRVRSALIDLWLSPVLSAQVQIQVGIALCKLKMEATGLPRVLITTLLANQDAALRKAASEALGWCFDHLNEVVPVLLMSALNDKNEEVRLTSENSLTHLKMTREKSVVICAHQLIESPCAETALRKSGQIAVPALIDAMGAGSNPVREKATRILGSLGELAAEAIPALTKALKDVDIHTRLAAAKGLWNINKNADKVVPILIGLLDPKSLAKIEDADARRQYLQTVMEALWRIGPAASAAVPALISKAKDKNRLVKESALTALKAIAPHECKGLI